MRVLAALILMILSPCLHAAVINVPADQPTIQAGIDAAADGDEVVIADGVYSDTGNFNLNLGVKDITIRSANGPASCILDCNWAGHGFIFDQHVDHAPTLDGLTIINGKAQQAMLSPLMGVMSAGGGVFVFRGSPIIRNCVFTHNTAGFGGAVAIRQGRPRLEHCRLIGNSAEMGGAVGVGQFVDLPPIVDCVIATNGAQFGGAVCFGFTDHTDPVIFRRCIISGNLSEDRGAVYSHFGPQMVFENCLMALNHGIQAGAAISYVRTTVTLVNTTIAGNTGAAGIGAVHQIGISMLTVRNSVIAGNTTGSLGGPFPWVFASESLIQAPGIALIGEGNIDADPQFVNAAQGHFRLKPTSPCVDAGGNSLVPVSLTTDLDGYPRILDGDIPADGTATVDMGCYEFVRSRKLLP